jgi:endonuclease/exonuclease/phosphatase family metal-dependent hydrolase
MRFPSAEPGTAHRPWRRLRADVRSAASGSLAFTVAVTLAATAAVCAAPRTARAGADADRPLSVLSYNVHGLFRLAAKDAPGERSRTIGWLASRYDIVLLQEDFEYRRVIAAEMQRHRAFRGNGMRRDPRLVLAKTLLFPARLLVPHFSPPYGAGLTTYASEALLYGKKGGGPGNGNTNAAVVRQPFDHCAGWLRAGADCWATKGFLRVRIRTPGGARIDVYNTHLDAGPGSRARKVRRRQLDQLATAIETLSANRAVIVAGDFNCDPSRLGDAEALASFRERVRLEDSGAGPDLPFWRERDYVFYRSGNTTRLAVEAFGEAVEFVNGDRALSDHPALYTRFRATASR